MKEIKMAKYNNDNLFYSKKDYPSSKLSDWNVKQFKQQAEDIERYVYNDLRRYEKKLENARIIYHYWRMDEQFRRQNNGKFKFQPYHSSERKFAVNRFQNGKPVNQQQLMKQFGDFLTMIYWLYTIMVYDTATDEKKHPVKIEPDWRSKKLPQDQFYSSFNDAYCQEEPFFRHPIDNQRFIRRYPHLSAFLNRVNGYDIQSDLSETTLKLIQEDIDRYQHQFVNTTYHFPRRHAPLHVKELRHLVCSYKPDERYDWTENDNGKQPARWQPNDELAKLYPFYSHLAFSNRNNRSEKSTYNQVFDKLDLATMLDYKKLDSKKNNYSYTKVEIKRGIEFEPFISIFYDERLVMSMTYNLYEELEPDVFLSNNEAVEIKTTSKITNYADENDKRSVLYSDSKKYLQMVYYWLYHPEIKTIRYLIVHCPYDPKPNGTNCKVWIEELVYHRQDFDQNDLNDIQKVLSIQEAKLFNSSVNVAEMKKERQIYRPEPYTENEDETETIEQNDIR